MPACRPRLIRKLPRNRNISKKRDVTAANLTKAGRVPDCASHAARFTVYSHGSRSAM